MEQFFEFISNHLILATTFVVLLIALVVSESLKGGQKISINQATLLINRDRGVLVDLRSDKEYRAGHIAGAINIPHDTIKTRMKELEKYKELPIILICKMGQGSGAVGIVLKKAGFKSVQSISGGMAEWTSANLPTVKSK
jgi:rhodanese-related sulfurtransferase